jgi:hypothetical protein
MSEQKCILCSVIELSWFLRKVSAEKTCTYLNIYLNAFFDDIKITFFVQYKKRMPQKTQKQKTSKSYR